MCSLGIDLIHSCATAKAMPHHPMDRLAQTTVGHHQPKYDVYMVRKPFIGWAFVGIAVDILAPVRGVGLVYQRSAKQKSSHLWDAHGEWKAAP